MRPNLPRDDAVTVADALGRLTETNDWAGLCVLLRTLDGETLAAARTWYRTTGRALVRQRVAEEAARAREARRLTGRNVSWLVRAVLAVALSQSAASAAREARLARSSWVDSMPEDVEPLVGLLVDLGPDWCAELVAESTGRPRGAEGAMALARFAEITIPVVARLGLDVPRGEAYLRGWVHRVAATRARPGRPGPTEHWRQVPQLARTLVATLGVPRALEPLAALGAGELSLEDEVRALVEREPGQREALRDATLALLARDEPPAVLALGRHILAGLGVGLEDPARSSGS